MLLSGADIITETLIEQGVEVIFGYPGVGTLIQQAILQSDYNMILGCITISIVAISTATLIVDLVYPFIDPRIRYS